MKTKQKNSQKSGWTSFLRERQATLASGIAALIIIVVGFLLFNATNQNTADTKQDLTGASTTSSQQKMSTPSAEKKAQASTPTPSSKPTTVTYRVARGDSLASIAEKFYGDADQWTKIAAANKLTNPSKIHVGNVLVIPAARDQQATKPEPKATPPSNNAVKPSPTQTYTVASGDTLWSIAERFYGNGFEWYRIRDANKDKIGTLANGRPLVNVGTVLVIPTKQV